jgi:hypothetical protein
MIEKKCMHTAEHNAREWFELDIGQSVSTRE